MNKRATDGGFFVVSTLLKRQSPPEWLMLGSFAVYCFVFPWAMLLLVFDWMPFGMEWMSSLLLAMLGLAAAGWLWANYGRTGLVASASIFALGLALEYVGVMTGFPFGAYKYTGVLVPDLPGGVPLAIGFAWLLIIVGSLYTARWVFSPRATLKGTIILSLMGAALAVGLDLLLEPVAYHVKNYWVWLAGGAAYYGIPASNFLAWLACAFAMNLFVAAMLGFGKKLEWAWLPVALFTMNVLLFGVVDVAHGYWIPGVVGLVAVTLIWSARNAKRNRPLTPNP
jgi:putative membrane protein